MAKAYSAYSGQNPLLSQSTIPVTTPPSTTMLRGDRSPWVSTNFRNGLCCSFSSHLVHFLRVSPNRPSGTRARHHWSKCSSSTNGPQTFPGMRSYTSHVDLLFKRPIYDCVQERMLLICSRSWATMLDLSLSLRSAHTSDRRSPGSLSLTIAEAEGLVDDTVWML